MSFQNSKITELERNKVTDSTSIASENAIVTKSAVSKPVLEDGIRENLADKEPVPIDSDKQADENQALSDGCSDKSADSKPVLSDKIADEKPDLCDVISNTQPVLSDVKCDIIVDKEPVLSDDKPVLSDEISDICDNTINSDRKRKLEINTKTSTPDFKLGEVEAERLDFQGSHIKKVCLSIYLSRV